MRSEKIKIEFWGDLNCPFCYIGDIVLKRTLETTGYMDKTQVSYRACRLYPDFAPEEQHHFRSQLDESDENAKEQIDKKIGVMKHLADKYDLKYGMDNAVVSNTSEALSLLLWVSDCFNQDSKYLFALKEALGRAFFSEGKVLSDRRVLLSAVEEVGLNRTEAEQILNNGTYLRALERDQKESETKCPRFIPTIYIGDTRLEGLFKSEQIEKLLFEQ
ncbi:MAG: DsbA family protein [Porphyromonas sp.]|nr:DsbA family protein [Porphyromonas sp.]